MRPATRWLHLACSLLLATSCWARTISVGPRGEVKRIAEAAERAQDGDVIEIASGLYRGDVAVWRQRHLTLRGVGPTRPVLVADGRHAEAKGIWVLKDGVFDVSRLEFRGARVPDGNGAGIRFERGTLRVNDCVFEDNQHGILTNNEPDAVLRIDNSRFSAAPRQAAPLPHLLYVGKIASLFVHGSHFQNGHIGHLIKSRARRSELRDNLVADDDLGSSSYELDFPNGGLVTLSGNLVRQGRNTENATLVAYGAEGGTWVDNLLDLDHNTLINDRWWPAWFVRVWASRFVTPPGLRSSDNLFVGTGLSSQGLGAGERGNVHAWRSPQHLAIPPGPHRD